MPKTLTFSPLLVALTSCTPIKPVVSDIGTDKVRIQHIPLLGDPLFSRPSRPKTPQSELNLQNEADRACGIYGRIATRAHFYPLRRARLLHGHSDRLPHGRNSLCLWPLRTARTERCPTLSSYSFFCSVAPSLRPHSPSCQTSPTTGFLSSTRPACISTTSPAPTGSAARLTAPALFTAVLHPISSHQMCRVERRTQTLLSP